MATRNEQKEKRRQEILRAGLDLFVGRGYAATKISDIAERVGMSAGLMFHYFESKEKLYETLIFLGVTAPMMVMTQDKIEPIKFFENAVEKTFNAIKSDSYAAKMFVLMEQAVHREAESSKIKELLGQLNLVELCIPIIEAGQNNKTIKEGDPYSLSTAFWAAVQGIAQVIALKPNTVFPESDWIVDIIRRKP